MINDYTVPKYFEDDYYKLIGDDARPPHRWVLIGSKWSGTTIHTDPLGTSAWNASLAGYKYWVLFPPGTDAKTVKGKHLMKKGEDNEAIQYFHLIYPRIIESGNFEKTYEFIQRPGDTVFIPGGWWHAVLNLSDTIAVTQNYCNWGNFDRVFWETRKGRPKMCVRWLRQMKLKDPPLYKRA